MYKRNLLIVFSLFSALVNAQSDQKATAILNKVSKLYKSYSGIKSTFTITTTSAQGKSTSSNGTLWIKGSKYKLDYAGQEIFCNGKFIWTFNKEDNEVTKENYKIKDNSITPNEIFTIYNRDFKNAYEGPTVKDGKTYEVIKMVSKKKVNYSYIKLEIDKSNNKIQRMIQHYKNGTEIIYSIGQFTPNTALADNFFEWNASAHPGVTEVDLTKK
ncbi:MAG: outer membrane lipoprotein carrier protein LolA [Bacteroidetes bacterium]|jgi:outer membrane lipoprotein-sorting protein|nr:outer membrane lipoprotein carrier protein LolA [Bacteroidota bacterium]